MSDPVEIIKPDAPSDAAAAAKPVLQIEYKPAVVEAAAEEKHEAPRVAPDRVRPKAAPPKTPTLARRAQAWVDRHGMKAAVVLLALGVGWLGGANTFSRPMPAAETAPWAVLPWKADVILGQRSNAGDLRRMADDVKAVRGRMASLESAIAKNTATDDLRALRKSVETLRDNADATRADRLKAINDLASRLDKLDAGARLDKLSDRLDQVERQTAAMPTGSIPGVPAPSAPATPAGVAPAPPAPHPVPTPPVRDNHVELDRDRIPASGWILREVKRGAALVEGREGVREVTPGDTLAGAGRVRSIEKRTQGWVVVTSNGVIDSDPY